MPTLAVSTEKVCHLIVKAREFDVEDANPDPDSGSNASDDREAPHDQGTREHGDSVAA